MPANTTFLFANRATSRLAAPIGSTDTAISLVAGGGAEFPAPTAGDVLRITLTDATTQQRFEIVSVTAISGDTLTVARAQEGTTAQNWAANDIASLLITAGVMQQFQAVSQAAEPLSAVDTGGANAGAITLPVSGQPLSFYINLPILVQKIATANTTGYTLTILNTSTTPTPTSVTFPNGGAIPPGYLPASGVFTVVLNGATNTFNLQSVGVPYASQTALNTTNTNLSNLQTQANTSTSNITTLQGQMTTANSNIANLQGRMSTAEGNITTLQGQFSTLNGQVAGILGAPYASQTYVNNAVAPKAVFGTSPADLVGSRAVNVSYTNTTGRFLCLSMVIVIAPGSTGILSIGGVEAGGWNTATATVTYGQFAIVPPGMGYSLTMGGTSFTLQHWMEM